MSESDVYGRQILTSKVCPRTERVKSPDLLSIKYIKKSMRVGRYTHREKWKREGNSNFKESRIAEKQSKYAPRWTTATGPCV